MPLIVDWKNLRSVARLADQRAQRDAKTYLVVEDRLTASYKIVEDGFYPAEIIYHKSEYEEPGFM